MAIILNTPSQISNRSIDYSVNGSPRGQTIKLSSSLLVSFYVDTSGDMYAKAASISGKTITYGAEATIDATGNVGAYFIERVSDTSAVVLYEIDATTKSVVISISGTTISQGTKRTNTGVTPLGIEVLSASLVVFNVYTTGVAYYLQAASISGTTLTLGTAITYPASNFGTALSLLSSTSFIVFYTTASGCSAAVCTISGTTITLGSGYLHPFATGAPIPNVAINIDSTRCVVVCYNSTDDYIQAYAISVSGTVITNGTGINVLSSTSSTNMISAPLLNGTSEFIFSVADGSSDDPYVITIGINSTTLTANTLQIAATTSNFFFIGKLSDNSYVGAYNLTANPYTGYVMKVNISGGTGSFSDSTQIPTSQIFYTKGIIAISSLDFLLYYKDGATGTFYFIQGEYVPLTTNSFFTHNF